MLPIVITYPVSVLGSEVSFNAREEEGLFQEDIGWNYWKQLYQKRYKTHASEAKAYQCWKENLKEVSKRHVKHLEIIIFKFLLSAKLLYKIFIAI